MIVLVTKEAGLRKNSNQKTKGLNPDLSLELGIVNIVVPTINVDNALHAGKLVKAVARKITLQRSVVQEAKANLAALVVKSHLSIERLILTRIQGMIR